MICRNNAILFATAMVLAAGFFPAMQIKAADNVPSSHHFVSTDLNANHGDHDRANTSLPTEFFANFDNSTKVLQDSTSASDSSPQTTQTVTSYITINPPLVNVGNPNNLNPNNGIPVVVAPEPGALLSGWFCFLILFLMKRFAFLRNRQPSQPRA